VRYQARAARLFLLAGLETGHLEELCHSSAGFHVLTADEQLLSQWRPLLTSPVHDPSCKPLPQKHGASLALALAEAPAAAAQSTCTAEPLCVDVETRRPLYAINGLKAAVVNPRADGFIVRAAFEGRQMLFLVPRLLAAGAVNGVSLLPVNSGGMATPFSAPCCHVRFEQSAGWMIGPPAAGQTLLSRVEQDLAFDHGVMRAGVIRSVLYKAVTLIRENHDRRPGSALSERALADAALDGAAASVLVMRLARALDLAGEDSQEAVFAAVMRPLLSYWLPHVLGQIVDCAIACTDSRSNLLPGSLFSRAAALRTHHCLAGRHPGLLVLEAVEIIRQKPQLFADMITALGSEIGTAGTRTVKVLQVAAEMALSDEGAAFLLVEQLIYAFASASLLTLDCDTVAAAYIESRLGGQWRSTYGMLSPRYHAGFILEALFPAQ